jgi:hypothetical protein
LIIEAGERGKDTEEGVKETGGRRLGGKLAAIRGGGNEIVSGEMERMETVQPLTAHVFRRLCAP